MFWNRRKKETVTGQMKEWSLLEAVDRALQDWHYAQHMISLSESQGEIDDAIYYLQLTEKRYSYLLNHARRMANQV